MRSQEKNRRSEADDRPMAEHIDRLIEVFDQEVAEIEADISALIKAEPEISEDAQLMRSLPGMGPVACMQLIAQMPELGYVGPKQVAALAGLAPLNVDSGSYRASARSAAAADASIWPHSMPSAAPPLSKPSMQSCAKPAKPAPSLP